MPQLSNFRIHVKVRVKARGTPTLVELYPQQFREYPHDPFQEPMASEMPMQLAEVRVIVRDLQDIVLNGLLATEVAAATLCAENAVLRKHVETLEWRLRKYNRGE